MPDTLSNVIKVGSTFVLIEKEIPIAVPTFGITLFTREVFSTVPEFVLGAYDMFEQICPRERLRFYKTENMTRHKPVTARTFGMLKTWLKPRAPRREYVDLELKASANDLATPDTKFWVLGREEDSATFESGKPNWVSIAFPFARMETDLDRFEALAERLFSSVEFVSGYAGLLFEISPYRREPSQRFAWKTMMRCRGFDLCNPFTDSESLKEDAVRGINWLTFVGTNVVKKLGGAKKLQSGLSADIEVRSLPTGLCFKAGRHPQLGDYYEREKLTSYNEVFRACEPAMASVIETYSPLRLETNRRENTTKWLRRLAYED